MNCLTATMELAPILPCRVTANGVLVLSLIKPLPDDGPLSISDGAKCPGVHCRPRRLKSDTLRAYIDNSPPMPLFSSSAASGATVSSCRPPQHRRLTGAARPRRAQNNIPSECLLTYWHVSVHVSMQHFRAVFTCTIGQHD